MVLYFLNRKAKSGSAMEDIFFKFPHLSEQIYDSLSNADITTCKEVDKYWYSYLDEQKFVEIRKIEVIVEQFHKLGKAWKIVLKKGSTQMIMDLRYGNMGCQVFKRGIQN